MDHRKTCRFCMKIIYNGDFDVIGEPTRKMLDTIALKMNLENDKEGVICHECAAKLQCAVDFKTTCITKTQKICRFCMNVTESGCYTCLQDNKENVFIVDMVQKHIPELRLSVTEEVVTCKTCLDSLQIFLSFIINCSDTEEKMKLVEATGKSDEKPKESPDFAVHYEGKSCSIDLIKEEDTCSENVEDIIVKTEVEYNDQVEIDSLDISVKSEKLENEFDKGDSESKEKSTIPSYSIVKSTRKIQTPGNTSETSMNYTCEICRYKFKNEIDLKLHTLDHSSPYEVERYECEMCSYTTKTKYYFKLHLLDHKNLWEVERYRCGICPYETRRKRNINRHLLTHQEPAYKCDRCPYKTIQKYGLQAHMRTHQQTRMQLCQKRYLMAKYRKLHSFFNDRVPIHEDVTVNNDESSITSKPEIDFGRHSPHIYDDLTDSL